MTDRLANRAPWFSWYETGSFPRELASFAGCDLSILHVSSVFHWRVRRDGCDIAEGSAVSLVEAKRTAEAAARHCGP